MMQPPECMTVSDPPMAEAWARWLGWTWVVAVVAAALAVFLGWESLAHALDLQSLLG